MSRYERLIERILRGKSDANIRFADLRALMRHLGFDERTRGSHYLYRRRGVVEKVNLQRDGANAKPYQVRQVRRVILKYQLGGTSDSQV
jgi:virulence-associated protein VapD